MTNGRLHNWINAEIQIQIQIFIDKTTELYTILNKYLFIEIRIILLITIKPKTKPKIGFLRQLLHNNVKWLRCVVLNKKNKINLFTNIQFKWILIYKHCSENKCTCFANWSKEKIETCMEINVIFTIKMHVAI